MNGNPYLLTAGLVALHASTRLAAGAAPPQRIVMLKWGENETAQGTVRVGPRTLAASRLWDGLGFGEVAIDFNHNTVPGHASYRGEPAPIAAMSGVQVVPGEGLVFEPIVWTEDGLTHRAHYPDLSPAVKLDDSGEVIFCHSAALARNGAVNGLHAFSADAITPDLSRKLSALMSQTPTTLAAGGMSAIDRAVAKSLGISPETWTRHNGGAGTFRVLSAPGTQALRPATETITTGLDVPLLLKFLGLKEDANEDQIDAAIHQLDMFLAGARIREGLGLPPTATEEQVRVAAERQALLNTLRLPRDATDAMISERLASPGPELLKKLDLPATATAEQVKAGAAYCLNREVSTFSARAFGVTAEDENTMRRMNLPLAVWLKHNPPR